MFEILIWHCVELSHQELIKDPFCVKSLAESGVLSQNVYSGLWLLSPVHWAEAVKSTHSMLTDNFQKFCDCFYARIYPPSPITSSGNEGRKALGKMWTLPCLTHWHKYYGMKSENFNWWLMKQCNAIPKFILRDNSNDDQASIAMRTVETARTENWTPSAPFSGSGLLSLLVLQLKKGYLDCLLLSSVLLQVWVTAAVVNICDNISLIILIISIVKILLLEASISLVLAEMNIVTFN